MRESKIKGGTAGRLAVLGASGVLLLGGCETDSWFDPSVKGRWEHTPAELPILKRIAAIEGQEDEFVEVSEVTREDLIPEIETYRIGPGDILDVTLYDIPQVGAVTPVQRAVDARGTISLPQLGEVFVAGMSLEAARRAVIDAMRALIVGEPEASVVVVNPRQDDYTILGAVGAPGRYFIPSADFYLLDAIAAAGSIPESTKEIFVIRQIPLTDAAEGKPTAAPGEQPRQPGEQPSGENLIDIIDDLTRPGGGGQPGAFGASQVERNGQSSPAQPERQPAIELVEPGERGEAPEAPQEAGTSWVYLNGKWVQVQRPLGGGTPQAAEELVTQRVIRVPVKPLLAGQTKYNIVIRPGDVIRVPSAPAGFVYLAGQVSRPGSFQLAQDLTLMRMIDSAGGLTGIAIPERVDLWRMVGDGRQAVIRLNLRAIEEGTQPDVFIKANDRVNVGTNFWAFPGAVVRNGFRASYGFGFLLDRNFGNDVFGAPPVNRASGF